MTLNNGCFDSSALVLYFDYFQPQEIILLFVKILFHEVSLEYIFSQMFIVTTLWQDPGSRKNLLLFSKNTKLWVFRVYKGKIFQFIDHFWIRQGQTCQRDILNTFCSLRFF